MFIIRDLLPFPMAAIRRVRGRFSYCSPTAPSLLVMRFESMTDFEPSLYCHKLKEEP
jgi:hypothetical protein